MGGAATEQAAQAEAEEVEAARRAARKLRHHLEERGWRGERGAQTSGSARQGKRAGKGKKKVGSDTVPCIFQASSKPELVMGGSGLLSQCYKQRKEFNLRVFVISCVEDL